MMCTSNCVWHIVIVIIIIFIIIMLSGYAPGRGGMDHGHLY